MIDVKALSESLLCTIKGFVDRSVSAVSARLDRIGRRFDELPEPRDGVDGHTPTAEEIQPLVVAEVAKAVAQIDLPQPKDGHTPTAEEIQPLVVAEVAKAVAQIDLPQPKDGHTPTAEEIQPLVVAEVAKAVAQIDLPQPKDGHTPTAEEIQPLVVAEVAKAVAQIDLPQPKDGHTPTAEEIQPLVVAEVAKAVAQIDLPQPKDGHTPTAEEIQPLVVAEVAKAVAQIDLPQPKDGHTPTAEEIQPLVVAEVAKAVAQIDLPQPKDGHTPTAEEIQPLVVAEVAKAVAQIDLPQPKDGEPGRDALDLHILPAIDVEKSYPRGTYAKHLGGLWRSYEPTAAMRGWECIVEGLATLQVEQDGDRKFVVTMGLSGGAQQVKAFTLPVMIYRGVYREGVPYEAGDTVTWGGSTWTCKQATDTKPGDGAPDWQLAVKKGRDAKPVEGIKT